MLAYKAITIYILKKTIYKNKLVKFADECRLFELFHCLLVSGFVLSAALLRLSFR